MIGTGVLLLLFGGQVIFMIKFFFFLSNDLSQVQKHWKRRNKV